MTATGNASNLIAQTFVGNILLKMYHSWTNALTKYPQMHDLKKALLSGEFNTFYHI